jgi:protein-S-isoprenylcysteine O-methyltransferase Ste14
VSEPLVFQHGAASVAFEVAAWAWLAFEVVMCVRQRRRSGTRPTRDPTGPVVFLCIAGAILAAMQLGRHGPLLWPGGLVWPVVVGFVLIVAGIALRTWSIKTLGRFFQYQIEIQADHKVVSGGPYRWVRHPSYSGIGLTLCGFAVASGDILSLVTALVLGGAGLAVRIFAEERQLTAALGAEYERFAASRKRLIPGVWLGGPWATSPLPGGPVGHKVPWGAPDDARLSEGGDRVHLWRWGMGSTRSACGACWTRSIRSSRSTRHAHAG